MWSWFRSLIFLTIGLALGVGLGLFLGWVAWPTQYTDATPALLQEQHRHDYTMMIAANYALDGDLAAARQRVNALAEDGSAYLFSVTLESILQQENEAEIRLLVGLAADLGLYSPAMDPYLPAGAGGANGS